MQDYLDAYSDARRMPLDGPDEQNESVMQARRWWSERATSKARMMAVHDLHAVDLVRRQQQAHKAAQDECRAANTAYQKGLALFSRKKKLRLEAARQALAAFNGL